VFETGAGVGAGGVIEVPAMGKGVVVTVDEEILEATVELTTLELSADEGVLEAELEPVEVEAIIEGPELSDY
jgi:hypothetical protein